MCAQRRNPLRKQYLDEMLEPFCEKRTGMAKLTHAADPECIAYAKQIEEGFKYHSMDAATKMCRAEITKAISAEDASVRVVDMFAGRGLPVPCPAKHPGLCISRDGAERLREVNALAKSFPLESALLRCEYHLTRRSRLVVYVKSIIGQSASRA